MKYIPISGRITHANAGPVKACQPKLCQAAKVGPTVGQWWLFIQDGGEQ